MYFTCRFNIGFEVVIIRNYIVVLDIER